MIRINGNRYPKPDTGLNFEVATLVDAGKNANGSLVGQKVGRDQYKINALKWTRLSASEWSAILKECEKFIFTIQFPDMVNNRMITLQMYPSNRSAQPLEVGSNGLPTSYKNCQVNFIDTGR